MLTKATQIKLNNAVNNVTVGLEISKRFLEKTPNSLEEVRSLLKSMDTSKEMSSLIFEGLASAMSHYDHGECGQEIAFEINNCTRALLDASNGKKISVTPQPMDRIVFEALSLALASVDAAREVQIAHDRMVECLQRLQPLSEIEQVVDSQIEEEPPIETLVDAKQDSVHIEKPSKPVNRMRIRRIRR